MHEDYIACCFQEATFQLAKCAENIPAKPLHNSDTVSVHLTISIAWEFATN